jgi:hypothetical protein
MVIAGGCQVAKPHGGGVLQVKLLVIALHVLKDELAEREHNIGAKEQDEEVLRRQREGSM